MGSYVSIMALLGIWLETLRLSHPCGLRWASHADKAKRMIRSFDVAFTSENFYNQTEIVQDVLRSQLNWTTCQPKSLNTSTNHHSNANMTQAEIAFMQEQNWADIDLFNFTTPFQSHHQDQHSY